MKKLLITGSAGFIGSNFIRKINYDRSPYKMVSIDKLIKPSALNNIYINNRNHNFHIGDICDIHFIDRVFEYEKPDFVVHFAAESFVDDSLKDPLKFIHSNVAGTQVLVNAAVKWGVEKFVLQSTDEVYGQLQENEESWTESACLNPRNPYSASKAASELILQAAGHSFGLNYNIVRSSNNYGPRQTSEKLIPKTIKCIEENKPIPLYGQGLQIRDWTYVMDNCVGIMKVLEEGKSGEIYNVSANQEFSNIEVIQKICNTLGKGHDLVSFVEDPRKAHDFRYSVNCNKIKELGWKPSWKFKDGIVETVQWYQHNSYFLK